MRNIALSLGVAALIWTAVHDVTTCFAFRSDGWKWAQSNAAPAKGALAPPYWGRRKIAGAVPLASAKRE
jgi:hypothetical protein